MEISVAQFSLLVVVVVVVVFDLIVTCTGFYGKEKRYHSLGDEEARAGSQGLIGFRLPHDYKYNNTKFRANGKKQRLTARDSYVNYRNKNM